jgi:hypothetical protein
MLANLMRIFCEAGPIADSSYSSTIYCDTHSGFGGTKDFG